MICLLLSTCVYPAVQSSEGRVAVTRSLSRQGSDVTDHPGFCNSGWGGAEEYRGQRTYSPCVPQPQVNIAQCIVFVCIWLIPTSVMYGWLHVCVCCLLQHHMLYRSDSADYRAQGPDMDSGVEAGSDMTPPTPAFPISPPTPYGMYCMFPVSLWIGFYCLSIHIYIYIVYSHILVQSFVC